MDELIRALGWRPSSSSRLLVAALLAGSTSAYLAAGSLAERFFGVSPYVLQMALWVAFLVWLGVLFPKHQRSHRKDRGFYPYRRAFFSQVIPGVALNFSQIGRPLVAGLQSHLTVPAISGRSALLGSGVCAVGAALIVLGLRALGIARTLFVHEYWDCPDLVLFGIYGHLRHPLFLGGVILSLGTAVAVNQPSSLQLALINVAVLPLFRFVEDGRSTAVHGSQYKQYQATVGAFLPKANILLLNAWRR